MPKLWTKDFIIVSLANFFVFLTFYLLMVTLTGYTINEFQASQSVAGLASSIFVLGAVLSRPITGSLIDRVNKRRMLFISLALFIMACVLYFFTNSLALLLINRFIHGVASGVATTALATIAAEIIPNERRGEGTGYFSMSMNLSMAIGPFIGLILMQYFSYSLVFLTSLAFAVAGLIATLFLRIPPRKYTEEPLHKGIRLSDLFEKGSLSVSLIICIMGIAYSSILSFLTSYSHEINLVSAASFFFMMFAVFLIASRPFTGRWFDKYGENAVVYPSILLFAVGLILLSQADMGITLLIAGAIIGIGYGTGQSSTQAIVVKTAPSHRIGLATSTFFTFSDIGIGVGPFLLGLVIPFLGYRGLYMAMSVVALFCMLVYYFVHGKNVTKHKVESHTF